MPRLGIKPRKDVAIVDENGKVVSTPQSTTVVVQNTTNVEPGTYYYPDSSGIDVSQYGFVSVHLQVAGGVTATIEITDEVDEYLRFIDCTKLGVVSADEDIPGITGLPDNTSFVDKHVKVDFNYLIASRMRIKCVVDDNTNLIYCSIKRI
jgi:hypothetical protein